MLNTIVVTVVCGLSLFHPPSPVWNIQKWEMSLLPRPETTNLLRPSSASESPSPERPEERQKIVFYQQQRQLVCLGLSSVRSPAPTSVVEATSSKTQNVCALYSLQAQQSSLVVCLSACSSWWCICAFNVNALAYLRYGVCEERA